MARTSTAELARMHAYAVGEYALAKWHEGSPLPRNPYPEGTVDHRAWFAGWAREADYKETPMKKQKLKPPPPEPKDDRLHPYELKKGEFVEGPGGDTSKGGKTHKGKFYQVLVPYRQTGVAELRNLDTGEVEEWNACNNRMFRRTAAAAAKAPPPPKPGLARLLAKHKGG